MTIMNSVFIIILIIYLIYVYIEVKTKKINTKKEEVEIREIETDDFYYKYAITSLISVLMGKNEYKIRRIFTIPKPEKYSYWKNYGRQEQMNNLSFLQRNRKGK